MAQLDAKYTGCILDIGLWPDEDLSPPAGTTVYNLAKGGTRTGTCAGVGMSGYTYDSARGLHGLEFNGTDARRLDMGTDIIKSKPITLMALVYIDGWGLNDKGMVASNGKFHFALQKSSTSLNFTSNNSNFINSAADSVELAKFLLVGVTRTAAGVANLYVNGLQSGVADQNSGTPEDGTANTIIGMHSAFNYYCDGFIYTEWLFEYVKDETQMYDFAADLRASGVRI